jgi:hypothetical protein
MLKEALVETRYKYNEPDYDRYLDETFGEVSIAGYNYNTSYALKELDPIAYETSFSDWQDMMGSEDFFICPICFGEYDDEGLAKYCCQEEETEN